MIYTLNQPDSQLDYLKQEFKNKLRSPIKKYILETVVKSVTKEKKAELYKEARLMLSYILSDYFDQARVLGKLTFDSLGEFGKQSKSVDAIVEDKKRKTKKQKEIEQRRTAREKRKEKEQTKLRERLDTLLNIPPLRGSGSKSNLTEKDVWRSTKKQIEVERLTTKLSGDSNKKMLDLYKQNLNKRSQYLTDKSILPKINKYLEKTNQDNLKNIYADKSGQELNQAFMATINRIVETETTAAYSIGRVQYMLESGFRFFYWTNREMPNEKDCKLCKTTHNIIFDAVKLISEYFAVFNLLKTNKSLQENIIMIPMFPGALLPPLHPYCSCFITPIKTMQEYGLRLNLAKQNMEGMSVNLKQFDFYQNTDYVTKWFSLSRQSQKKNIQQSIVMRGNNLTEIQSEDAMDIKNVLIPSVMNL